MRRNHWKWFSFWKFDDNEKAKCLKQFDTNPQQTDRHLIHVHVLNISYLFTEHSNHFSFHTHNQRNTFTKIQSHYLRIRMQFWGKQVENSSLLIHANWVCVCARIMDALKEAQQRSAIHSLTHTFTDTITFIVLPNATAARYFHILSLSVTLFWCALSSVGDFCCRYCIACTRSIWKRRTSMPNAATYGFVIVCHTQYSVCFIVFPLWFFFF